MRYAIYDNVMDTSTAAALVSTYLGTTVEGSKTMDGKHAHVFCLRQTTERSDGADGVRVVIVIAIAIAIVVVVVTSRR